MTVKGGGVDSVVSFAKVYHLLSLSTERFDEKK